MDVFQFLTESQKEAFLDLPYGPIIKFRKKECSYNKLIENLKLFETDQEFNTKLKDIGIDPKKFFKIISKKRLSRRDFLRLGAIGTAFSLGYYAEKNYSFFHRTGGLLDRYIFKTNEIHTNRYKKVIITIDDGPCIHNERKDLHMQEEHVNLDLNKGRTALKKLIYILKKAKTKSVLFWIGKRIETAISDPNYEQLIIHIIRQGFVIGNHSYTHRPFSTLTDKQIIEEIDKTDALIEKLYAKAGVARELKLFRFPYGDRPRFFDKPDVYTALTQRGYSIWFWSLDTLDWHQNTNITSVLHSLEHVKNNDIILIHERIKTIDNFVEKICLDLSAEGIALQKLIERPNP